MVSYDPEPRRLVTEASAHIVPFAATAPPVRSLALLYLSLNLPGVSAQVHAREPACALQSAVMAALTAAVSAADTAIQLEAGTFACLFNRAPSRATLSLLSWALLDVASNVAPNARSGSPWRWAIGVAMGLAPGATFASLLRNADAAMHRARRQRSGFAFFDERVDVWELRVNELEAPGV